MALHVHESFLGSGENMERGLQEANHCNRLAEWAQRVEACRKSGQKVSEWCTEQGIAESTYYSWQRKVFQAATAKTEVCFAEIPVRSAGGGTAASIESGGLRIEIHAGADAETVRAIIQALKEC